MKIHDYGKIPEGKDYSYSDIDNDDERIRDHFEHLGIDEVWYWYASADYEGSGQMIIRKNNLYDHLDLGHCSCNDPISEYDNFEGTPWKQFSKSFSDDLLTEVGCLLKMNKLAKIQEILK